MAAKPKTVDEYLAGVPPKERAALQRVRRAMLEAAPDAREVVSYAMPGIRTTRVLAWYAAFPNHLSIFAWPETLDTIAAAKKYRGTKSALHFSAEEPIPLALVKRIVKAQLAAVDAKDRPKAKPAKPARKKAAKARAKKAKAR